MELLKVSKESFELKNLYGLIRSVKGLGSDNIQDIVLNIIEVGEVIGFSESEMEALYSIHYKRGKEHRDFTPVENKRVEKARKDVVNLLKRTKISLYDYFVEYENIKLP